MRRGEGNQKDRRNHQKIITAAGRRCPSYPTHNSAVRTDLRSARSQSRTSEGRSQTGHLAGRLGSGRGCRVRAAACGSFDFEAGVEVPGRTLGEGPSFGNGRSCLKGHNFQTESHDHFQ